MCEILLCNTVYSISAVSKFGGLINPIVLNRIGGAMVSMLVSRAIDYRLHCGQIKDYQIGIFSLAINNAAFKSQSKDWLAHNHDRVERHVYPQTVVSVS